MSVDISLSGIGDLVEELENMVSSAAAVEEQALQAAADLVLNDAKQTTAFVDRTHTLRNALSNSKVKMSKGKKYVLTGALKKEAFYAGKVEFGTSKSRAHPFLMPAYERHKNEIPKVIGDILREALK